MSPSIHVTLLCLLVLSVSVWTGGYAAIIVVARTASTTLHAADRVAFFRSFGRAYLPVGTVALVVALATGGILLGERPWDPLATATVEVAALLVVLLGIAVLQARRMTRLRRLAARDDTDTELAARVSGGAVRAGLLRAALGLLTVALIVLGCVIAA
ncbi:hypothetical protein SAMN04489806_2340 [Paramicrobacterium humi]|uniref:DUF1772 domain-containing protein n=1 Tax=Paramicrobacterium humi TaxID=640635 RepID=A0A1H4NY81_9MICO|nr:hypothetical protein [Microbacterium humi]SEC00133.1 hypothetical protein SAMN04489806_2340 [Microbacterium humi]